MREQRARQIIFVGWVVALSLLGLVLFVWAHHPQVWRPIDGLGLLLFVVLFVHLSFGVVSAITGFIVLLNQPATESPPPETPGFEPRPRTALIMPIYHEDAWRVFAGMKRMVESLNRSGRAHEFDTYVLSDSQDPNAWIEEEKQWLHARHELGTTGRIFYRRRKRPIHQKSGNVADFCRRWGKHYRYMIVLDADSIMTANALLTLVDRMERNPSLGIIQTLPRQVLGTTVFARIQQFGSWLYSPMFAAGASYWQGDSGPYWGHNAIIRVAPFIEYCGLPEVPRLGPFRGRFLSHDSVEAAFMRRLGYGVRLAYDLEGSYEEGPPDLATALKRDRRWCRGNMQHLTLLGSRGLRWENRILFVIGVMAYLSALLWLLMIVYTVVAKSPGFPNATGFGANAALLGLVALALLTPKLLGAVLAFKTKRTSQPGRLVLSLFGEFLASVLVAPIQMISHSGSVLAALHQRPIRWSGQDRQSEAGSWESSLRSFAPHTIIGLVVLSGTGWYHPAAVPWLLPVAGPLCLSIPLTHLLAKTWKSAALADERLFAIPEELNPPRELEGLDRETNPDELQLFGHPSYHDHRGILQVLVDPYLCAAHILLLGLHDDLGEGETARGDVLSLGPDALTADAEREILNDADAVIALHRRIWSSDGRDLDAWWLNWLTRYSQHANLTHTPATSRPESTLEA